MSSPQIEHWPGSSFGLGAQQRLQVLFQLPPDDRDRHVKVSGLRENATSQPGVQHVSTWSAVSLCLLQSRQLRFAPSEKALAGLSRVQPAQTLSDPLAQALQVAAAPVKLSTTNFSTSQRLHVRLLIAFGISTDCASGAML